MAMLQIYLDSKSPGVCRSCGAAIEWAELTTGKRHPFNRPIVPRRRLEDLPGERLVEEVDTAVSTSHFATCPDAQTWRRRSR